MEKYFEGNAAKVIDFNSRVRVFNASRSNFGYKITNTTPVPEIGLQIPSFMTPAAMAERRRRYELQKRMEEEIAATIFSIAQHVVFLLTVVAEIAGLTYLFYTLGLAEHPAYTAAAMQNRAMTALIQSVPFVLIFNYFAVYLYNHFIVGEDEDEYEEYED